MDELQELLVVWEVAGSGIWRWGATSWSNGEQYEDRRSDGLWRSGKPRPGAATVAWSKGSNLAAAMKMARGRRLELQRAEASELSRVEVYQSLDSRSVTDP